MKIAVVGSGGWGTALALVLLENGHEVTLWSFSEKEAEILCKQRENPLLKGITPVSYTHLTLPTIIAV